MCSSDLNGAWVLSIKSLLDFSTPKEKLARIDAFIDRLLEDNPTIDTWAINKKLFRSNAYIRRGVIYCGGITAVDGGFVYVVDACAEASAHIRHIGIAIEAREQSEAVDDEVARAFDGCGVVFHLAHHHCLAVETAAHGFEALAVELVGRDDAAAVGTGIEPGDEDVFVGLPAAAGNVTLPSV